jgi:hypothetical protein
MHALKLSLLAALGVAFASVAHPVAAFANDADFVLKNRTGYQIDEVYVSRHSSKSWGKDVMGSGSLESGRNVKIVFPHGNGACHFDIKVKYEDGDTAEWGDVNLCDYESITLFWDQKNQVTRAEGE